MNFVSPCPCRLVDTNLRTDVRMYNETLQSAKQLQQTQHMQCTEKRSIVFIKTHKAGSTTLIAPLQKYAYTHNLTVMVPQEGNNMFNWPLEFRPNKDNVAAENGEKFDLLVNHIIFNKTSISPLMKPNTQYITILREPLAHLRSTFQYFGLNTGHRLGSGQDAIKKYLSNPIKYDTMPEWMEQAIPLAANRVNSMTRNLQAADLGLSYWDFDKPQVVDRFIKYTINNFDFIVILERMHESLVLLRRHMCWKMEDILFLSKNVNPFREFQIKDLTESTRANAYRWNKIDNLLYQAANRQLDQLRRSQSRVQEEIAAFKAIQLRVSKHCWQLLGNKKYINKLVVAAGDWNEEFVVDGRFCALLLLDERDMTHVFKCRQHASHKDCKGKSLFRVTKTMDMIEGKQRYQDIRMTPRTIK